MWRPFAKAALVAVLMAAVLDPAGAFAQGKKLPPLPARWWDAASCANLFIQTSTPIASAMRLNNIDPKQRHLRIKWVKVQRRLNGMKIDIPYTVPCREGCEVPPGGQTEIFIVPSDFPDRQVYEEAEKYDLGCEAYTPKKK